MADTSTTALLAERVRLTPAVRLVALPDSFGGWFDLTAQEFSDRVEAVAKGLMATGLHSGDRLGVICSNRFEATLVDFAAGMVGVATVPVDRRAPQSELLEVLDDAGATAVLVETPDDFARFDELHSELPAVRNVWQLGLGALDKLSDAGLGVTDAELAARVSAVEASTPAALLYSANSDDGGGPRHRVLTHGVLATRARGLAAALGDAMGPDRSVVQILPATDPSARVLAAASVLTGTRLGHLHDSDALFVTLHSFRPTLLAAAPETFARIDDAARSRSEAAGRSTAFRQAHDVALEYGEALTRGPAARGLRTRFAVADTLVLRGLRKSVGGQVSHALSIASSTTLPPRLRLLMLALDVRPLEGFGTAATSGLALVERSVDPLDRPAGVVGAPLPGVEVDLADDGEVLLRGEGVAVDAEADGWLRTGISGELVDGRLALEGRDLDEVPVARADEVAPERTGSGVDADF